MAIQGIGIQKSIISYPKTTVNKTELKVDFAEEIKKALDKTSELQKNAQAESQALLTGETENLHSVVVAAEKADLALRLTLQVRNKALDAYNEIMHMQV